MSKDQGPDYVLKNIILTFDLEDGAYAILHFADSSGSHPDAFLYLYYDGFSSNPQDDTLFAYDAMLNLSGLTFTPEGEEDRQKLDA